MSDAPLSLEDAVPILASFLSGTPLTSLIAQLEQSLDGASGDEAARRANQVGLDASLLAASVTTRDSLGRLNDLIHAVGIALALPHVLHEQERIVNRPSLAAGNDPSRPYDLETDRRIAEFKFSVWTGRDAMRKRQTFKDFVHLAADTSGRQATLYVIGGRPARFLRTTRSSAAWGLDRSPTTRQVFGDRFGDLSRPISEFVREHDRVEIVDLRDEVPQVFGQF